MLLGHGVVFLLPVTIRVFKDSVFVVCVIGSCVSKSNQWVASVIHLFPFSSAIKCPSLSLTDGMVTYAADATPDFAIGTVATHTCSPGFSLVGVMTRTCMDDDQADIVGVWSGAASSCEGNETHNLCLFVTC